jgi:hypothetical protein
VSEPAPGWAAQLWHDLGVPATLGAAAAGLAWLRAVLRRRRARGRQWDALLVLVQVIADKQRREMHASLRQEPIPEDEYDGIKHRLDDAREGLWLALGNESRRIRADARRARTTQRLKRETVDAIERQDTAAEMDIFRPEDTDP